MSLTPRWEEKDFETATPGLSIELAITTDTAFYYLDNGSEFKKFPATKKGWSELCETLKDFEP